MVPPFPAPLDAVPFDLIPAWPSEEFRAQVIDILREILSLAIFIAFKCFAKETDLAEIVRLALGCDGIEDYRQCVVGVWR
jgi:hypothetical protein